MTAAYDLKHLHAAHGNKTVLKIDRLSVQAGRITALIGPNGAGKSTLLSVLAFIHKPAAGELLFFGESPSHTTLISCRRRVGLVSQNSYLLRGTVLDNVAMGLKLRGIKAIQRQHKALEALRCVGLERLANRRASGLSGGEAQKVALARTLALDPEVLLFDEPFTYLDQNSIETIERLIRSYSRDYGRTVVFTTHDRLHGMAVADDVSGLLKGQPTRAPLINLFSGGVVDGFFDTGKIRIVLSQRNHSYAHASIDPNEIVLSLQPLTSSIRNAYRGRVIAIAEDGGRVRITIQAGERFQVLITRQSLDALRLTLGAPVWASFKSTAVRFF